MKRILIVASTTACLLMLTACGGAEPPVADPTVSVETSTPTPTATRPPTPTPTPTPAETTEPEAPAPAPAEIVIPACADLFSAAERDELWGAALTPVEAPDRPASTIPEVRERILGADSVNCTWARPATERGVVISIIRADSGFSAETRALFESMGFSPIGSSLGTMYSGEGLDTFEYTESHIVAERFWVAVFDGAGIKAAAISMRAAERIADLNR